MANKAMTKSKDAMELAAATEGTKSEAEKLDKEVVRLAKVTNETFIQLGEKLDEIMNKKLYRFFKGDNGQPFQKFEDYISARLGMGARSAFNRMKVYRNLCVEGGLSKEEVMEIPYSKALLVSEAADTGNVKDVAMWVEKAKEKPFDEFQEEAKWHKRKKGGSDTGEVPACKLHFLLTSAQMDNVNRALAMASKTAESRKDGHLLDLICTSYQSNEALKENVDDKDLLLILKEMERIYGFSLLVVKDEKVLYGSKKMLKVLGVEEPVDKQ